MDDRVDDRFYWFARNRCGENWEYSGGDDVVEYRLWEESDDDRPIRNSAKAPAGAVPAGAFLFTENPIK